MTAASRSEIEKATLAQLTKAAQAQKDSTSVVVGATNTTKMARANSFAAATAVANKDVEMAAANMGGSAQKHQ